MNKPATADYLILHGTLLCMDDTFTLIEDGGIAVNGDCIIALGNSEDISSQYTSAHVIDATDCIITPGLINAHSHLPMTYFKGLADDLPLMEWLQGYIWPLEGKLLSPQFVYDATVHGAAEMLLNGITLTNDMYFYGDSVAEALLSVGMRGIVGEAVVDFKLNCPEDIGREALALQQKYAHSPLIDVALTPHSIYACSANTLQRCAGIARQHNLLTHIHLSETAQEVQDSLTNFHRLPVEHLADTGMLDTSLILAHGIYVSEAEMQLLAAHEIGVAICTESNLKLASGIAPIKAYLDNGVRVCLGTDGVASNNNTDILGELNLTAKLHKAVNNQPTFLPARQALSLITSEAAKALRCYDRVGSLEAGKQADIVVWDCHNAEAQPIYNPYSQMVYALTSSRVKHVMVNGNPVVTDRSLTTVDMEAVLTTAAYYRDKIKQELR